MPKLMFCKVAPFDRSHMTSCQTAVVTIALSCTVFKIFDAVEYCDLEIYAQSVSR